ncbi:MAG TPA: glycosyltransferase family 2 protein [Bryobacteraceae bacterium]|nr:glycosyltransferase family 2 protein [Bryobacteraceae bacterium]
MNRVAIVIVTFQSAEVIGAAVDSGLKAGAEVIVVDNASTDSTLLEVQRRGPVRLIANVVNRGFAAAVNQGVALTARPLILLLNPDAVVVQGLDALAEACSLPQAGAATGKLLNPQGMLQRGFAIRRLPTPLTLAFESLGINRIWPSNPVNRRYRCLDFDENKPSTVEQPPGAFLMIRRDVWEKLGGFDERFHPLWFEDVDYCNRLIYNGFQIYYEPRASARHLGGHSAGKVEWGSRELYWYASLLRYAAKHFSRASLAGVSLAVIGGRVLQLVTGIHRGVLKSVSIYAKVIRLAFRYLVYGDGQ